MKYEEKSFSVSMGGKAYGDGYDAIDWGNKGAVLLDDTGSPIIQDSDLKLVLEGGVFIEDGEGGRERIDSELVLQILLLALERGLELLENEK